VEPARTRGAIEKPYWLIALVALDLATKALAFLFLQADQEVRSDAAIQFVLRVNRLGLGTWGRALLPPETAYKIVPAAFAYIALAALLIAARKKGWRRGRAILLCTLGFVFTYYCFAAVASSFQSWPHFLVLLMLRGSGAILLITAWALLLPGRWKLAFLLLSASAAGNFLSLLYPPFGIVDFVYSSVFQRVLHFGVFNLADVFYLGGVAMLIVALFASLGLGIVRLARS
jgi:lipoprotein signal peptidase